MAIDAAAKRKLTLLLDKMAQLNDEMDVIKKTHTAKINSLGEKYNKMELELAQIMKSEKMTIYGNDHGVVAERKSDVYPDLKDYEALKKYIVKEQAWDLLGKTIGTLAFRERLANGIKVPGVIKFTKYKYVIKRVKGKGGLK